MMSRFDRWPAASGMVVLFVALCRLANARVQADDAVTGVPANDSPAPLHLRIDEAVERHAVGPQAELADDLTFMRRVFLDLAGRVPPVAEVREFQNDTSPQKRAELVDRLISSPDLPRHLAGVLEVMLMERRGGTHVKSEEFRAWLQQCLEADQSYLEIVQSLLAADGEPGDNRPASAFYLERSVEPNLLTRDIGRIFFGMDLQCAQCHDHPVIDDYLQGDYYGLYAFVNRLSLFQPDKKKPALVAEAAVGDASFKSVFTERQAITGPRLPGGAEFTEPVFAPGDEYEVRPAKGQCGIPKYSRRRKLAELVGAGGNHYFNRNIANRLWALMLGRGLVHPVDQHHSDNPPSNPELLNLLASEFAASGYDIPWLLREIALTEVYQRSYRLPSRLASSADVARGALPELKSELASAEEAASAAMERSDAALEKLDEALAAARPLRDAFDKVKAAAVEAAKKRDAAAATLREKQKALDARLPAVQAVEAAQKQAVAAAEILPDDSELKQALATLQKKAAALTAERTKLEAAVAAARKPAEESQAALKAAQDALQTPRSALEPAEAAIREARSVFVAATEQLQNHRATTEYMQRRIELLETLVALADSEQEWQKTAPAVPAAVAAAEQTQRELDAARSAMMQAADDLAQAQRELQVTTAQLEETQKSAAAMSDAARLVTVSLQNAQAAAAKLTSDQELAAAVRTLATREATLASTSRELEASVAELTTQRDAVQAAFEKATERHRMADQALKAAVAASESAFARRNALQEKAASLQASLNEFSDAIIEQASSQFNIAVLEPLTPEQLAWSMLQATGQFDRQVAAQQAALDKKQPLTDADRQDAARVRERERQARQDALAVLEKIVAAVANYYAAQKGQPQDAFFATVDQALYLANGSTVNSWLNPAGDNLTARLQKLEDTGALAEELYLTILTRQPTAEETQAVAEYLQQRADDRPAAVRELAWALLTSVEFRFHH